MSVLHVQGFLVLPCWRQYHTGLFSFPMFVQHFASYKELSEVWVEQIEKNLGTQFHEPVVFSKFTLTVLLRRYWVALQVPWGLTTRAVVGVIVKSVRALKIFFEVFIYLLIYFRETERVLKPGEKQRGKKRERIPSRLHTERGAQRGAQSHNSEIVTWAEAEGVRPSTAGHPGAPSKSI